VVYLTLVIFLSFKDSLRSNKICSVYFPYTAVDNLLNNALKNKDFQINNVKLFKFLKTNLISILIEYH